MNQELDVEAETFLYRGELLLRGKESFVAGFSGSGKTISGCATRRDDDEFQRAKHLPAVA